MKNNIYLGVAIFLGVAVVSTVGALLTTQTSPVVLTQQNVSSQNTNQDQEVAQGYDGNQVAATLGGVPTSQPTPTPTPTPAPTIYWNVQQSYNAYCSRLNGTPVAGAEWRGSPDPSRAVVDANTFSSTISASDANNKASDSAKAKAYAAQSCQRLYRCDTNPLATAYCASGYVGGPVTSTVNGSNYTSTVSVASACASATSAAKASAQSGLANACVAIPQCVGPDGAKISVGQSATYWEWDPVSNNFFGDGSVYACGYQSRTCVLTSGTNIPPNVSLSGRATKSYSQLPKNCHMTGPIGN